MSSEAVAGIWIGAAALNGTLIWMSVGVSRLFGRAVDDDPALPTEPERRAQPPS